MWFVYIALCSDNSLYTGISNDVDKRFLDHQLGKGARYTKSHKVLKLVYKEQFKTQSDALKRESEIKSWKREEKIQLLKLKI